ncbi:hypothetical protein Bca52824_001852 [Brassica carinata]|uniref:Uncharacterized protein n=1 Tax=Brassica carinata TaxID=52824 RepID=A0A8X8BEA8_BRACI|nr:hypothetical protein Bca52824_001852 [Brassica carinata]
MGGIRTNTGHIPSFSFRKRPLSRERSCQAPDSSFSSSLTIEDGFCYDSFEDVGYDFNTIELSQLVRRFLSCFDSQKFFVAVHWSVEVNAYKPGDQCILGVLWV